MKHSCISFVEADTFYFVNLFLIIFKVFYTLLQNSVSVNHTCPIAVVTTEVQILTDKPNQLLQQMWLAEYDLYIFLPFRVPWLDYNLKKEQML